MGGGGGKSKSPEVEPVYIPDAPTPAPPPEPAAERPALEEEGLMRRSRDAKKRGTSALRINLNVQPSTAVPGGGGGLNIPKG